MSLDTLPHALHVSPLADLPPALVALLRDEANLSMARQVLEDARQECLTHQESVQAQRPALGFLAGKKQREDYAAASQAVLAKLAAIDAMLARVNAARERLQAPMRAALIEHLSQTDAFYRQGLHAGRSISAWSHGHQVITDRLRAFLRDGRELRAAIAADASAGKTRYSSDSSWRLTQTRAAAAELEKAVDDLNRARAQYAAAAVDSTFAEIRLPLVEPWNSILKVDTVAARTPGEALPDLDRVITEFAEFKQPSLDTLAGMFNAAAGEHAQVAETCLRRRWSELLAHAEAHLVADAELEPTLADIERRQAQSERARLVAEIPNKPFSHER